MSATHPRIPEPLRHLARIAREAGWAITRAGSGHLRWQSPAGDVVITSGSPGDRRSALNERSRLRRAGLRLETP